MEHNPENSLKPGKLWKLREYYAERLTNSLSDYVLVIGNEYDVPNPTEDTQLKVLTVEGEKIAILGYHLHRWYELYMV